MIVTEAPSPFQLQIALVVLHRIPAALPTPSKANISRGDEVFKPKLFCHSWFGPGGFAIGWAIADEHTSYTVGGGCRQSTG